MTYLCRFCSAPLNVSFADLGVSPISNDFISREHADAKEPLYPLHAYVCNNCFLVQLVDFEKAENLFSSDYAYFSSYSETWLAHAREFANLISVKESLGCNSLVVEIASNDGYLLQYFKELGVPTLGVEPTENTARVAIEQRGVPTRVAFFGKLTAEMLRGEGVQADVIVANNVLAHVPDINDFVAGFPLLLKSGGVGTIEFPHLLSQIQNNQFDTIYHEHFSYLSFTFARKLFAAHGMRVYDKEELPTHGGSLRLYVCHENDDTRADTAAVEAMMVREARAGLGELETYRKFSNDVHRTKANLLDFLFKVKGKGKSIVGYGAPAKGVTLLNYCGINADLLKFTVDKSPYKIGKLMPGVRIPILSTDEIFKFKPDYVLILPWNLKAEIMEQMADIKSWGGKFVTPIPRIEVH